MGFSAYGLEGRDMVKGLVQSFGVDHVGCLFTDLLSLSAITTTMEPFERATADPSNGPHSRRRVCGQTNGPLGPITSGHGISPADRCISPYIDPCLCGECCPIQADVAGNHTHSLVLGGTMREKV